jgi:hypothetical protein
MKRLTVEPRTSEWHAIRAESWTASAAATLVCRENAELIRDYAAAKGVILDIAPLLEVGIDSYFGNTPWKVWAEKWGRIPRFAGNDDTERGTRNEEKVVRVFEEKQLIMAEREVTALSSADPWLLASFDAMAPASSDPTVVAPYGFPVEAKCPAFHSRKKLWDAKKEGKLSVMGLPYYWCQVQHQILVAEAPYGWFVAAGVELNADGIEEVVFPIVEKVPRDERFLAAYHAIAKFYFEEFIDACLEPPKLPSDVALLEELAEKAAFDKAILTDNHDVAVEIYLESLREEKAAVARRKELEQKVLDAAAKMRAEGDEFVLLADRLKVTYSSSSSVSWQKAAKELAKRAGLSDIPEDVIKSATSKPKESVKVQEVS